MHPCCRLCLRVMLDMNFLSSLREQPDPACLKPSWHTPYRLWPLPAHPLRASECPIPPGTLQSPRPPFCPCNGAPPSSRDQETSPGPGRDSLPCPSFLQPGRGCAPKRSHSIAQTNSTGQPKEEDTQHVHVVLQRRPSILLLQLPVDKADILLSDLSKTRQCLRFTPCALLKQ